MPDMQCQDCEVEWNCDTECLCCECDSGYCRDCCCGGEYRSRDGVHIPMFYKNGGDYYRLRYEPAPRLFIGIESEMEWDDGDEELMKKEVMKIQHNRFYSSDYDGSLSCGIEVKTRPFTFDWIRKYPKNLQLLIDIGKHFVADRESTCGMHINLSRNFFSKIEEYKLSKIFNGNLAEMVAQRVREMRHNTYCRKRNEEPHEFHYPKTNGRFDKRKKSTEKYLSINRNAVSKLEIRMFQGTTKKFTLYKNIEFAHASAMFVKQSSLKDGDQRLLAFIRTHAKTYKHLNEFLIDRKVI